MTFACGGEQRKAFRTMASSARRMSAGLPEARAELMMKSQSPNRKGASSSTAGRPCRQRTPIHLRKAEPVRLRHTGTRSIEGSCDSSRHSSAPTWPLAPRIAILGMQSPPLLVERFDERGGQVGAVGGDGGFPLAGQ